MTTVIKSILLKGMSFIRLLKILTIIIIIIRILPKSKWEKCDINDIVRIIKSNLAEILYTFFLLKRTKISNGIRGAKKSGINWFEYQPIPVNRTKNKRIK
jgi:hypothetical protein